jgi:8-oxo-dGTP diphosphatase
MERPSVGSGIIIENADKKILAGKRIGSHAPFYSIPDGHLEIGETIEEAAIKEVYRETDLVIKPPKVFCVTNNLRTFKTEKKHHISVTLHTNEFEGTPKMMEKHKCEFRNGLSLPKYQIHNLMPVNLPWNAF